MGSWQGGGVFVEGLRDRARPPAMHSDIRSRVRGVVGRDRSPRDAVYFVDLTSREYLGVCRMELPDCVYWWRFCGSRGGRGFWCGMASVQRLREECEEWVTFLYEKMNVMDGVSDVGNHERV